MNNAKLLAGLSEKQIAKVKSCKSSDEILALAKAEGVELTDEQLHAISGGCGESTKEKDKVDNDEKNPLTQPF